MKNNYFWVFLNKPHYKIAVVTTVLSNNASDVFYLNKDLRKKLNEISETMFFKSVLNISWQRIKLFLSLKKRESFRYFPNPWQMYIFNYIIHSYIVSKSHDFCKKLIQNISAKLFLQGLDSWSTYIFAVFFSHTATHRNMVFSECYTRCQIKENYSQ